MVERRKLPANYHSLEYGGIAAPIPLLVWPAYMALPFLRTPLGYRLLTPWQVAWYGGGLLCLQIMIDGWLFQGVTGPYLRVFIELYPIVALARWFPRWRYQGQAGEPHTMEAGHSWLAWYAPLPVWLTEIFIVPAVVGGAGWEIATEIDAELGFWLMMIGASLFWMATWEYRRSAALRRAIADDLVRADTYEHHIGGAAGGPAAGKSDRSDGQDYADLA